MNVQQLMEAGRRYVYWLDLSVPAVDGKHRVSLVFENEPGHFPTGSGGYKAPWYWSEETCKLKNEQLGYSEEEVFEIVSSSMFQRK